MSWRVVCASVAGPAHLHPVPCCQDAHLYRRLKTPEGEEVLLSVVADGAGSASRAQEGAQVACQTALGYVEDVLAKEPAALHSDELGRHCISAVREALRCEALALGCDLEDLACTLLVACCAKEWNFFLQIGDGAIVCGRGDTMGLVFEPMRGEYVNETHFVTAIDAASEMKAGFFSGRFDLLAMLTDGLQGLAIHLGPQTPHPGFFDPFLQVAASPEIPEAQASAALELWLRSPALDGRTDDDKTLLVAYHAGANR